MKVKYKTTRSKLFDFLDQYIKVMGVMFFPRLNEYYEFNLNRIIPQVNIKTEVLIDNLKKKYTVESGSAFYSIYKNENQI